MQMHHRLPLYIEQTFFHFSHNSTMAQFNTSIGDLIQQIRFVENHHNQLVDQYFQLSKFDHIDQIRSISLFVLIRKSSQSSVEQFK